MDKIYNEKACDIADTTRRQFLKISCIGLLGSMVPFRNTWAAIDMDYHEQVAALGHLKPYDKPLLKFSKLNESTDFEIEALILKDISGRSDLIQKVKSRLGDDPDIRFSMDSLKVRLLFVPEIRANYAESYERFCRNITSFIFGKVNIPDFYSQLVTPMLEYPEIKDDGVSAFMVHQLAKEYVATCKFSNVSGDHVRYRIKGAAFSNHLGAVDLNIDNPEDGSFKLNRGNYTIWQNRVQNPYMLFVVPVEETLHYILGPYTDRTIHTELDDLSAASVSQVKTLAQDWMMVEEAIVGGLISLIIDEYSRKYQKDLPTVQIRQHFAEMRNIPQYKYRFNGIKLVRDLGIDRSYEMYREDPMEFKKMVLQA
ncbi:MAG: hypothetical protein HKM93_05920 [Desulfobacteraceae bacterium]|nr:hypothetical protein [Desulfobacteraceae bacterium]